VAGESASVIWGALKNTPPNGHHLRQSSADTKGEPIDEPFEKGVRDQWKETSRAAKGDKKRSVPCGAPLPIHQLEEGGCSIKAHGVRSRAPGNRGARGRIKEESPACKPATKNSVGRVSVYFQGKGTHACAHSKT